MTEGGCRKCGCPSVEDPRAEGWGDGGSICPGCRAERNRRAAEHIGRVVGMATLELAHDHGLTNLATIRRLPEMTLTRSFAIGDTRRDPTLLDDLLRQAWRELGDGHYLLTVGDATRHEDYAVDVFGDEVEMEPIPAEMLASLPDLYRQLASTPLIEG